MLARFAVVAVVPFLLAAAPGPALISAPVALFNGKDLSGWTWHPTAGNEASKIGDVWTIKDGVLHSAAKPTGYIRTAGEYKNFTLTIEQRHLTKANGGVFICIHGDEKVWPDAVQIQGKFGNVGDLINQNSGMKAMTTDPKRTAKVNRDVVISRMKPDVEKPLGEWNTLVITMRDGNLRVTLNGELVNEASGLSPDAGKIGIQAEGAEMEFRKITLTPAPAN